MAKKKTTKATKKKVTKKKRRRKKRLKMAETIDCLTCGLCCLSLQEQDAFADLEPADLEQLPRMWVNRNVLFARPFDMLCASLDGANVPMAAIKTKTQEVPKGPMKGYRVCSCVALEGNPMEKVSCSIYPQRPRVCHEAMEPGDFACRKLRRKYIRAVTRKDKEVR